MLPHAEPKWAAPAPFPRQMLLSRKPTNTSSPGYRRTSHDGNASWLCFGQKRGLKPRSSSEQASDLGEVGRLHICAQDAVNP